jgi:hypothetical protein
MILNELTGAAARLPFCNPGFPHAHALAEGCER